MTFSARLRILAGLVVGASLALAGCTVPGQPAPAGAAAAYEQTTISNERVNELFTAWRDEGDQRTSRRSVVTLELLREPLLQQVEELEVPYHRSAAEQQAALMLRQQGSGADPSEALVDAAEAAVLVAIFVLSPELTDVFQTVVLDVEEHAVTSPRTGEFSAARVAESIGVAYENSMSLYNQNMPTWTLAFRSVNAFTVAGAEWLATDAAATQ